MKVHSFCFFVFVAVWFITCGVSRGQAVDDLKALLTLAEEQRFDDHYLASYATVDSALEMSFAIADSSLIATCFSEKGVSAMYLGWYGKALNFLQKGLLIREELSDSSGMQESFNYIATVHHAQANYNLAQQYYNRSLEIAESIGNRKKLAVLRNNLGVLLEDRGQYAAALETHQASLAIWEEMKDTAWISVSLRHIGKCYSNQDELTKAMDAYQQAYQLSIVSGSNRNVVHSAIALGELNLKLGEHSAAKKWCERAHNISMEHNILVGIQKSAACLSSSTEKLEQYSDALNFFKLSQALSDSIYGNERMKELTQLELSFQFEKEQLADSLEFVRTSLIQEKKISNQRIGLFSIGVITIIMIILAFVVYQGKQRSEKLLLNILPKEVAAELKQRGKAKARKFQSVSVIFTDFKGFTQMSETLSAEDLVEEINLCFSAFDAIMDKYGIEKIKTIGDAYMAVAGLPIPNERHAQLAVSAALEMVEFMKNRKAALDKQGALGFEMRVGIHSGDVVAGIVGTKKFQYDIWGDTVNTAARMESTGEVSRVNISDATYKLIKNEFSCTPRGSLKVKGKGMIEMFFVESLNQNT